MIYGNNLEGLWMNHFSDGVSISPLGYNSFDEDMRAKLKPTKSVPVQAVRTNGVP